MREHLLVERKSVIVKLQKKAKFWCGSFLDNKMTPLIHQQISFAIDNLSYQKLLLSINSLFSFFI